VPATARSNLRLLRSQEDDPDIIGSIVEWAFSAEDVSTIFAKVANELPGFDEVAQREMLDRIEDLSRTVSALTGLNLMSEVYDALDEQQDDGVSDEDFEAPDIDGDDYFDTVAETNNQSAYSLGKVDEDADSGDWWEYSAQPDACPICAPLDGTQAPQDDGVWADRIPPLHPDCVCDLKSIPAQGIRATEHDVPNDSRGTRGWGNPQKRFDPDLSDKPAVLLPAYHEKLRNLRRSE